VPIDTLRQAPFSLEWGDSVFAKVFAFNLYGDSPVSETANGAVILTIPDAPVALDEDYSLRTKSELGLVWTLGPHDGGASVQDFQLSYDQGIDDYVILE
jgi:hypothetical protein